MRRTIGDPDQSPPPSSSLTPAPRFHRTPNNLRKERIYLGGLEIYRETTISTRAVQQERQTVHLSDDQARVCLMETRTVADGSAVGSPLPRARFQFDNHLGTACVETDETGAVISYEEYHPYGTSSYRSWKSGVEVSAKRYRYTGKERDEETSLYYHGARYYAPWLGRWMSADPAGTVDGSNLFAYVRGSPVVLSDPSGMSIWDEIGKLADDVGRLADEGSRRLGLSRRHLVTVGPQVRRDAHRAEVRARVRSHQATGQPSPAPSSKSASPTKPPSPSHSQASGPKTDDRSFGEKAKVALRGLSYGGLQALTFGFAEDLGIKPTAEERRDPLFQHWAVGGELGTSVVTAVAGGGSRKGAGPPGDVKPNAGGAAILGLEVEIAKVAPVAVGVAGIGVGVVALATGAGDGDGDGGEQPRDEKGKFKKPRPGDAPPGRPAEDIVKDQLEAEGNTIVGSRVTVRTPLGNRVLDHVVQTPEGKFVGVEVKSGGATKSFGQFLKDKIISSSGGVFTGKNAPDALRGRLEAIDIITRRVP